MFEKLPEVIGHVLADRRVGLEGIAFNTVGLRQGLGALQLSSLAFADHAPLPERYTADGEGHSPPLAWRGVPAGAGSLVLLVEDADSPTPHPLVQAIVVGLAAQDSALAEGALAEGGPLHLGRHSLLGPGWLPPDPPPGHGTHRYCFQLFALDAAPEFSATPGREETLQALRAHAIAAGLLIGTYARPDGRVRDEAGARAALPPSTAAAG